MFSWCPTGENHVILLEAFIANIPKAMWHLVWGITAYDQWHKIMKFILWEQFQVLYVITMLQLSPP